MPLLKDGRLVDDPWQSVADDEEAPAGVPIIISFERWTAERDRLAARPGPLGLRLRGDQGTEEIEHDLGRFDVIALQFHKFTDGRAYSTARLLRERHGYDGELRAVGEVLRDQLLFMTRCGFDAFEVDARTPEADWRAAMDEIGVYLQPAADIRVPPSALRRRRDHAAA